MNALPWEIQLAAASVTGFAAGLLVMWLVLRPKTGRHKQEREMLMQEFGRFRRQVDEHFVETAAAVDELNRSYQKVIRHLSSGAHSLMDKKTLQEQLTKRGNASITVAYLAAEAAATADTPETAAVTADAVATPQPDVDLDEQTPVSDAPVITPPPLAGDAAVPPEAGQTGAAKQEHTAETVSESEPASANKA
ncbi:MULTISPECIES: DUF1043 family protein [unclassified Neisseria]|uniref:ZapG family protein n=1 Tax=unclassified Neisseria TaxID=2623750 RepID=UPI0010729C68|nr:MULTISPECIES: DUF1043 family protein [unclassified Neisseria]MBF0803519.1 DUF1043 family protein [Neisseria sp. 19428wB4_WF04]TFU43801.1 DUF1043 family protein [Neisseria sp. WF04]